VLGARRVTRAVIVAVLLSIVVPPAAQASHGERLEETRREIRATRARISSALVTESQIEAQLSAIVSRLRVQQAGLSAARAQLTKIDIEIRAQKRRLDKLAALQAARRDAIAERARALYIMGPADTFQALTTAGTLEEFVDRAGALEQINGADNIAIEELETARFESKRIQDELRVERAKAAEIRDEIRERVQVVAEMAAVQREAHDKLNGKISGYRNNLAALQREQARIEALIRARQSTSTGPISRSGFIWPIRGPITSPYGPRWGSFHTGMDIDCRTGDGIKASKAGTVIESGWGGGYGNMIIIDHGNGVSTLYAHQSRLYRGRGSSVSQGTVIGACGTTGNSTGDHLHFEVRINGRHTNPRPYLP